MRWLLALATASALALIGVSAAAMGGLNMVTGRMVLPRADAPSLTVASSARGHYVLHCAGCHRVDGTGTPAQYVPDLRQLGQFLRLDGGRAFVIGVPGVMGSGLNDAQVAEVANWLLATIARDSVPKGHQPYTAAEVAATRQRPMADVAAERQRLLEQARARGITIE